jgi:hypothetical protein
MKGGWRATRAASAALALAVSGSLATPALAEKSSFHVRPTIKLERTTEKDTLSGKLRSKAHACEANRKVKLRHRRTSQLTGSKVVTKLRTNRKGKWEYVPRKNQNGDRFATPGNYHVKAGEKRVGTGDGTIVCHGRNSPSLLVG